MNSAQRLNAALVDRLGDSLTPAWKETFLRTPRHYFVPDRGWRVANGSNEKTGIDRESDEDGWLEAVYSDDIIITHSTEAGDEGPSSNSLPSMVATMLGLLDVQPDDLVGEIGTGPGWSSALLAHYLNSERSVYTVEVDPAVAQMGEHNHLKLGLKGINRYVHDGVLGFPGAPQLQRIMATCTVHKVPYAWIEQTAPGGVILTPWGTDLDNGALLKLTADGFGGASGKFVHTSQFMWLRSQQFQRVNEPGRFRRPRRCVHSRPGEYPAIQR